MTDDIRSVPVAPDDEPPPAPDNEPVPVNADRGDEQGGEPTP